jgi:CheY-like chemotaxis protein
MTKVSRNFLALDNGGLKLKNQSCRFSIPRPRIALVADYCEFWVQSTISEFTVTNSNQNTNQRVLVVEDDPIAGKALSMLLRDQGYDPVVFADGSHALDYLRQNDLDAALIDIHLPDISGLDLSHRIRESHGQKVPIFILSGDNSLDTLRALPDAGATYFFSKPINATHLLENLKIYMSPV